MRGVSETERSQRSPSWDDIDVAGWRRVSCWSRRCALGPSSPARREIFGDRSAPTNHRRRPSATVHCHAAPHKLLAQVGHPAGRSRMLVAVHGLALRSASDAVRAPSPMLKPDRCRAPPRSSHRAAGGHDHQRLARAREGREMVNATPSADRSVRSPPRPDAGHQRRPRAVPLSPSWDDIDVAG